MKATMDDLRKGGLKLAIGSSSRNACFILGQLGLDGYFDAVSDGNQITHSKPDPEVFLLAAKLIGEKPEDCLVVEDARAGLMAAKAGGMDGAGIGDAADCELADYHLRTFKDLLTAVLV